MLGEYENRCRCRDNEVEGRRRFASCWLGQNCLTHAYSRAPDGCVDGIPASRYSRAIASGPLTRRSLSLSLILAAFAHLFPLSFATTLIPRDGRDDAATDTWKWRQRRQSEIANGCSWRTRAARHGLSNTKPHTHPFSWDLRRTLTLTFA